MILADTGVWIDHFRNANSHMAQLLSHGQIAIHPYVVAELALGSLRHRARAFATLDAMSTVRVAGTSEVRNMIEAHKFYARGIGLIDAHLIAACLLTPGTRLWTRDAALRRISESLHVNSGLA